MDMNEDEVRPLSENSFRFRSGKNGRGTGLDPVVQVNLVLTRKGEEMTLKVTPEATTSGQAVVFRPDVDSSLRELTYALHALDKRAWDKFNADDDVAQQWLNAKEAPITGLFRLAVRELGGKILFERKLKLMFGPAQKQGAVRIYYKKDDESLVDKREIIRSGTIFEEQVLETKGLSGADGYIRFLKACTKAFEVDAYPLPEQEDFVVELSFRHQDVTDCSNEHCSTELANYLQSWIPPRPQFTHGYPYCLGTTLCRIEGDGLSQVHSPYWKRFGENVKIKKKAGLLAAEGKMEEAITAMEAYFETTPSDRHAARLRLQLYDTVNRREQAYPLVTNYQPYFLSFREPHILKQLSSQRALLKKETANFSQSSKAWLHITKPVDGDIIAGATAVEMIIKDDQHPILSIDAYIDGKKVASIENPPARLSIDPATSGDHELEVIATFENKTYCSDKIALKSIRVDESEEVYLLRAQVTATRGNKPIKSLEKEDFKVTHKGRVVSIGGFSKEAKPLEIIVLIDSSISMALEQIFPVRNQVLRFLQKLPEQHATAVYTFEDRVTRLKDFDEPLSEVAGLIQTINADGGTALYDALLAARGQLLNDRDTLKVLIVLTDGVETRSRSNGVQVSDLLDQSSIMVYSIYHSQNDPYLEELAKRNGGFAQKATRGRGLESAFDRILESLGATYFLNFSSRMARPEKVKIKAKGAKLHWKIHH